MTRITNTTQLSTFSTIRTIIRGNATLAAKYTVDDFYEFMPNFKSSTFKGLPFMLIETPNADTEEGDDVLGNVVDFKGFTVTITIFTDYSARDQHTGDVNQALTTLRNSQSTLESAGYDYVDLRSSKPDIDYMNQKQVVFTEIELDLAGEVGVS